MKIKWRNSISARINGGMIGILVALFVMAALSFWMTAKFNTLSQAVADVHLPELAKSSDLQLAIKNIHRKISSLTQANSKIENRIIVQKIINELAQVSAVLKKLTVDKYSRTMTVMSKELLPIVNSYSYEVDNFQDKKAQLRNKVSLLDQFYSIQLKTQKVNNERASSQLNTLYIIARSLGDLPTTFLFKQAQEKIEQIIKQLKQQHFNATELFDVIENPGDGIVAILQAQSNIKLNLSVLNTQTNVIIEQLNSTSLGKVLFLKKLVASSSEILHRTSNQFNTFLITIVLLTSALTVALMYFFHQSISKRLMIIANSLGPRENQTVLEQETQGTTEISIIAKSIVKYIGHNEQQNAKIQANVKQLTMIIENSSQAVLIYCQDKIVYSNEYCNELLDVNDFSNTDIVSQNLLIAIDTMTYQDRLKVGPYFFRFFATDIDWNGKRSTLVLLIDISNEVNKEKYLIKTLKIVKDESLTDTLTGLYNRRKLELFIEQLPPFEYALIIADIDFFKAFNDLYGHGEGDLSITKVALAIKQSLRTKDDLAVRYGGEEFLILLLDSTLEQAEMVADRIQNMLFKFNIKHEKSTLNQLSLSLGIAHSGELDEENWQALFNIADKRLYQAKSNGRARIVSRDDDTFSVSEKLK